MFDYKNASKKELTQHYNEIAAKLGDDRFFTRKELNYLPDALQPSEQVLGFTSGLMGGNTWLTTLTDRRILFLDKGLIYGLKQTSIPLSKVNAVSGKTGIFFGEIHITDGAGTHKIDNVLKKTVGTFTNLVQDQIDSVSSGISSGKNDIQNSQQSEDDPIAKIERLASLKEKGIISADEFESQKQKLLAEI